MNKTNDVIKAAFLKYANIIDRKIKNNEFLDNKINIQDIKLSLSELDREDIENMLSSILLSLNLANNRPLSSQELM